MRSVGALICVLYVVLNGCTPKPGDKGFMLDPEGRPATWRPERLPQRLMLDPSLGYWADEFAQARLFWERVVGREVFEPVEMGTIDTDFAGDTIYIESTPDFPNPTTVRFQSTADGHMVAALIFLPESTHYMPDVSLIVATHELGHCLGLDDDQAPESIMHSRIDLGLDVQKVRGATSLDKERLRRVYHP